MTDSSISPSLVRFLTPALVGLSLTLAGCGGGGGGGGTIPRISNPANPQQPAGPVPSSVSYVTDGDDYQITGLPRPNAADARHSPIYGDGTALFVGLHLDSARLGTLPVLRERGGSEIRYGQINNGAGASEVVDYLSDAFEYRGTVDRYADNAGVVVRVISDATQREIDQVIRAVQFINAALPEGSKLVMGAPLPGFSLVDSVSGRVFFGGSELGNTIQIEFVEEDETDRTNYAGRAWGEPEGGYGYVQIRRESNSYRNDRLLMGTLLHEILHTYPGYSHIDRLDSIMYYSGDRNSPISRLSPLDREALQAVHRRYSAGDSPSSLGPWASAGLYLAGNNGEADFGVVRRNGYFEPWARGHEPDRVLASNPALSGTATWDGEFVGLTPNSSAVIGDASIQVNLSSLTGRADFTSLETWGPDTAPGAAGSGTTWGDGDLGYNLRVRGNTFRETGGDSGRLTGIFVGESHEGATGVLERTDVTGAFGATR